MNKSPDSSTAPADRSWFERNVNGLIWGLVVACVLSLLAHWFPRLGYDDHHPAHFSEEKLFGFQAVFGFVVFVVIVFLGRGLRLIVDRREDYYDRD